MKNPGRAVTQIIHAKVLIKFEDKNDSMNGGCDSAKIWKLFLPWNMFLVFKLVFIELN